MHLIYAGWLPTRNRLLRLCLLVLLVAGYMLLLPSATSAHPLGNFTINRYSRLEVGAQQIDIFYVLDMAEIAAFQEIDRIDTDQDGQIATVEQERYLAQQQTNLGKNLSLLLDGKAIALDVQEAQLEFPAGEGGLRTLRLRVHLRAALPQSEASRRVAYHDASYAGRLGWQEVLVRATPGVRLFDATVSDQDLSQELRVYPQDLLQSPLAISSARFSFQTSSPAHGSVMAVDLPQAGADTGTPDRFAALIQTPIHGPFALAVALLLAFGLGAAHALTPGHGKTVVAAYLVGSRGTVRHAIFLGLTTTITHTAGVFALGIITLFVSEYILPEQIYPWLEVTSGIIVCGLGITLLHTRLRGLRWHRASGHDHPHSHAHDHHDHVHADEDGYHHHHETEHAHDHHHHHHHGSSHVHSHMPPGADGSAVTWRSLLALGVSGGLLPCPSALIVLLSAIALGRTTLGLLLIVAFSLGLASVLTIIGVLLVHARKLFHRVPLHGQLFRTLPVASAVIVVLLGAGITVRSLIGT